MTKTPEIILKARNATEQAEELIRSLGVTTPPVDPLAVIESESPLLAARGDNFRDRFDGQIEYHPSKHRFLLLYNTKYDQDGRHHPRTRFSIAHELGHYFIESHHAYLRGGGKPHPSRGEFASLVDMEREADAFAAGLLMPSYLISPRVNETDLSLDRVRELADHFQTSLVSTAIRSAQCSHFPTAVAGIRDGNILWQFQAQCLVESGCYPGERGSIRSLSARNAWKIFQSGKTVGTAGTSFAKEWFRTYDKDELDHLSVTEEYLPVPSMRTLVVLLSIPEDELYDEDSDE